MRTGSRIGMLVGLAFGIGSAWPVSVRADVAPYPRPTPPCKAAAEKGPGEECLDCKIGFDNPDRCETLLKDFGFDLRCRGRGSVRNEAWCRTAKDAKPVPAGILSILGNPAAKAPAKPAPKVEPKAAPDTPVPPPAPSPAKEPPAPSAPIAPGATAPGK